jgi:hypothetical protein
VDSVWGLEKREAMVREILKHALKSSASCSRFGRRLLIIRECVLLGIRVTHKHVHS